MLFFSFTQEEKFHQPPHWPFFSGSHSLPDNDFLIILIE